MQTITLTAHERREFARCAQALYRRGSPLGHTLSAVAAKGSAPIAQYDRAAEAYRAWLVFDEPKPCAPFVDVGTVTEYGLTQKLSNAVRVF